MVIDLGEDKGGELAFGKGFVLVECLAVEDALAAMKLGEAREDGRWVKRCTEAR